MQPIAFTASTAWTETRICDNSRMLRTCGSAPIPARLASLVVAAIVVASVAACGGNPSSAPLSAVPSASAVATATESPTPLPTPEPTVAPPTVAFVPVADYRTTATAVDATGVASILAGKNKQFNKIEVVDADADGILAALGTTRASVAGHLAIAATVAALDADLAKGGALLGFVRASDVGPSVRAIDWDGKSLFGVNRFKSLTDWPLKAYLAEAAGTAGFDPTQTWTTAAAGDVMLDRGVYDQIHNKGKGADFPFDGGSVAITGHFCCSPPPYYGNVLPKTKRLSTAPLVRNLMSGADLSMVNLEGPAPIKSKYHTTGKVFTFNQAYLSGLKNAGIDVVSLANNHIGNAGRAGMHETMNALTNLGVAYGGLGNNEAEARKPVLFNNQGVKVAFLAYDAIAPSYWATPTLAGSAQMASNKTLADIRAAKAAGAQVVIVFPHWGVEYHTAPTSGERNWAHKMIDAGADLIIGNHVHYVAAMEVYKGKPIWYALGDFVFDQNWSEPSSEGLILELSFNGPTLVQAWMHPILDLDASQPNLLDAASGQVVLKQLYNASAKLPTWK